MGEEVSRFLSENKEKRTRMHKLGWLHDLCAEEEDISWRSKKFKFLLRPFRVGDYAVATNGHTMAAIKFDGECPFKPDADGEQSTQVFLSTPPGNKSYPLEPLKDWAARRYDDNRPDSSILHGAAVDRRLVWQALRNIHAETYLLNQVDQHGETNGMFVFDGEGWRVFIMGLRNTKQTGNLPEYTPAEHEPRSRKPVKEKDFKDLQVWGKK